MPARPNQIPIGEIARRTGLSISAIRFYESRGLVQAGRNSGGQRRFARSDIRRLSFVMIAQQLGYSIERIGEALAPVPTHKAPTKAQWKKLATGFHSDLDERIQTLTRLRDKLDGCIGCGCLSLEQCALYNPGDREGKSGTGPRFIVK